MDYDIQVHYLRKEMLIYELSIRGIPVDNAKTVDELRAALRPIFQLEKKGKRLTYLEFDRAFDEECDYIVQTLKEIENTLEQDHSRTKPQSKFERLQSQLMHLFARVDRIPVDKLSAAESKLRSDLLLKILAKLDSLEGLLNQDLNLSAHLDRTYLESSDSDSASSIRISKPKQSHTRLMSNNNVRQPVTNFPSCNKTRVEKWGLKFTGDIKSFSVHNFLDRVAELREARGVSERELFESAIDLFSAKALNWFRANRNRFSDWNGLSDLLCKHFEPPDYRPRLFKEILERTQDSSESIVDYLSSMSALFRRYGSLSANVQLDIVSRNLSPFYTTQLPEVHSLEELEEECLKLEAKKYRADHYVPPSRKRHGFVEPDFAFVATEDSRPSSFDDHIILPAIEVVNTSPKVPHFNPQQLPPSTSRPLTCWNCNRTGHLNRQCPDPRKMHCYRCGASNVTSKSCPKCSLSGNGFRERR